MSEKSLTTIDLETTSMVCQSCSLLIELTLGKQDGVKDVKSDYASERTKVSFDPSSIGLDAIIAKIEELGYHAKQVA